MSYKPWTTIHVLFEGCSMAFKCSKAHVNLAVCPGIHAGYGTDHPAQLQIWHRSQSGFQLIIWKTSMLHSCPRMTDGHNKDMKTLSSWLSLANHGEWGQLDAVAEEVLGRQGPDLDRNKVYPAELTIENNLQLLAHNLSTIIFLV